MDRFPNKQPILYYPPRTVVAMWSRGTKERCRQYVLWSSGELDTKLATTEYRFGRFELKQWFRWEIDLPQQLDQKFHKLGYQTEYLVRPERLAWSKPIKITQNPLYRKPDKLYYWDDGMQRIVGRPLDIKHKLNPVGNR